MSVNTPQTPSVIDTLSEGYRSVNRRPLLLLVPVLLNLYLWFGVQVSFGPLINTMVDLFQDQQGAAGSSAQVEQLERLREMADVNVLPLIMRLNYIPQLSLAQVSSGTSVEADVPGVQEMQVPLDPGRGVIVAGDLGGGLLALLLANLAALTLSAPYLTRLAEAVRDDKAGPRQWLRRAWRAWLAMLGYVGVVLGVIIVLGLPFVFLIALMGAVSSALALMGVAVLSIVWFWAGIYLGFAPEAIVVSGIGPLRALRASFQIVRQNFFGTLGLLLLSYIIGVGSGVVWLTLQTMFATTGLLVGIVGSAYIGSGLLAARMAFYRERLRRWQATAGVRG
ncbi:MAG TPA: hypothetical protein VFS21_26305 [Roseiflexaceae bacterium]|nr:hypothetical protein [Roseiflexaceae bacterium]